MFLFDTFIWRRLFVVLFELLESVLGISGHPERDEMKNISVKMKRKKSKKNKDGQNFVNSISNNIIFTTPKSLLSHLKITQSIFQQIRIFI
jgi:hypothetical protein